MIDVPVESYRSGPWKRLSAYDAFLLLVLVMQVEIVEVLAFMSVLLEKESAEFAMARLFLVDKFFLEAKLKKELSETK